MTAQIFPANPTTGQLYVGDNGASYVWMGNRWNSTEAIRTGNADYFYDGGYSTSTTYIEGLSAVIDNNTLTNLVTLGVVEVNGSNLSATYTLANVAGALEQGIIVGPDDLRYDGAGEVCDSTGTDNNAWRYPMRDDGGPMYNCSAAVLTIIADGTYTQTIDKSYFDQETPVKVVAYIIKDGLTYYSNIEYDVALT